MWRRRAGGQKQILDRQILCWGLHRQQTKPERCRIHPKNDSVGREYEWTAIACQPYIPKRFLTSFPLMSSYQKGQIGKSLCRSPPPLIYPLEPCGQALLEYLAHGSTFSILAHWHVQHTLLGHLRPSQNLPAKNTATCSIHGTKSYLYLPRRNT